MPSADPPVPAQRERFDALYTEYLPPILGYALRRCTDRCDAADVAADVFLTLWRRLADVPAGAERMWLFGVARHALANHRRGQLRRTELAARLRVDLLAGRACPPPAEGTLAVTEALAKLPARDRELLALAVWDGLLPSEIAELEGIPAATVRSRLLRARARLRELLDPEADAPRPLTLTTTRTELR